MNPASNADGARYTPSASMPWKKRLKRSTSQAVASAYEFTCAASVKNRPNMPQTWLVASGTPACRAASRMPSTSRSVAAASRAWKPGAGEALERREARRHRDRIAGQRARLVDGPERRDAFHDVAPAAECADRHAAADDLAERREVRLDAVALLCAAERDAEAGHHLVEDQHGAVLRALLAQRLEETGHRRDAVHVAGDRLDDHAGDVGADLGEGRAHLRGVVVLQSVTVYAASSAGTPGEVGTPSVSMPEPALTSSESEWPW